MKSLLCLPLPCVLVFLVSCGRPVNNDNGLLPRNQDYGPPVVVAVPEEPREAKQASWASRVRRTIQHYYVNGWHLTHLGAPNSGAALAVRDLNAMVGIGGDLYVLYPEDVDLADSQSLEGLFEFTSQTAMEEAIRRSRDLQQVNVGVMWVHYVSPRIADGPADLVIAFGRVNYSDLTRRLIIWSEYSRILFVLYSVDPDWRHPRLVAESTTMR